MAKGKTTATKTDTVERATWSVADKATLVRTLKSEKEAGRFGDNNPKPVAYKAVMTALAGSEKMSGGGPKTVSVIKSCWQKVRVCIVIDLLALLMLTPSAQKTLPSYIRPYCKFIRMGLG
jgi:hypothetical protein